MKLKSPIMVMALIFMSLIISIYSVHAISGTDSIADFDAVKTHINDIQTHDGSLPSGVAEPKGRFWALISRMFTANGKIGNRFIKALGLRSNNTVLKWSGGYDGELVNSSITDNGSSVWISGNLSVSGRIATSTPTANNHAATKGYVDGAVSGVAGGDDLWNHTAIQNLNLSGKEIDNIKHLDLQSGTGNGLRFWQSNNFKISMGNAAEYKYGPVQDYSIKSSMSSNANRGWTWGVAGQTPVMALANSWKLQVKNDLIVENGSVWIGITPSNKLHVSGNIGATGWIGSGCEWSCDSWWGYALMYGDGHTVIRPSYAWYALNAKTSSASHGGVIWFSENWTVYGSLGHANSYWVYGRSNSGYWIYGRTTSSSHGWVLWYNHDASAYGILWHGSGYAFYGKWIGYFNGNVIAKNPTASNHLTTKSYVDAAVSGAGGAWSLNGNKAYYSSGNVGIGISNPSEKLDIAGSLKASGGIKADGWITVDGKTAITSTNYSHRAQSTVEDHYWYFAVFDNSGDRWAYFGYWDGDSRVSLKLDKADELYVSGWNVNVPGKIITSTPTAGNHVATKSYVDLKTSPGAVWGVGVTPSETSCTTKTVSIWTQWWGWDTTTMTKCPINHVVAWMSIKQNQNCSNDGYCGDPSYVTKILCCPLVTTPPTGPSYTVKNLSGYECSESHSCETPILNICQEGFRPWDRFKITTDATGSDWLSNPIQTYTFTVGSPYTHSYTHPYRKANTNKRIYDGGCDFKASSQYGGDSTNSRWSAIKITKIKFIQ